MKTKVAGSIPIFTLNFFYLKKKKPRTCFRLKGVGFGEIFWNIRRTNLKIVTKSFTLEWQVVGSSHTRIPWADICSVIYSRMAKVVGSSHTRIPWAHICSVIYSRMAKVVGSIPIRVILPWMFYYVHRTLEVAGMHVLITHSGLVNTNHTALQTHRRVALLKRVMLRNTTN